MRYEGEEEPLSNEHVDTRGVWPMYVRGVLGIVLVGKRRDISLDDAREVALSL